MFLTEKRDKSVTGQMVQWKTNKGMADKRRLTVSKPYGSTESIMLTAVIDAHEGQDIMCADIPNTFFKQRCWI